jgi:hypothetical protein
VLNQLPEELLPAIHRLKNNDDFLKLADYLQDNKWLIAEMACNTQGVTSDEYSGGYKVLDVLLKTLSLDEYNTGQPKGRRFE